MQHNSRTPVRRLAEAGLIAAMYAALTLLLPAPSFGIVQCRFSEMLTVLAVFTPIRHPRFGRGLCGVQPGRAGHGRQSGGRMGYPLRAAGHLAAAG